MTISSAKRKFIYEHLWLHLWLFLTPKKREAQNIYDSLMIIFDKKVKNHPNPSKIPFWSIQAIHDLTFNL